MKTHSCGKFRFLFPVIVLVFLAIFSLAVYLLWNHVLVDVLGVRLITYWQALGILVLAKILFSGFPGRRGGFGPPWRRRFMMERWESLTPEERERMREEMRQRFGDWPRPPWCESGTEPPSPQKS
jgi:hypothetical protein